MEKAVALLRPGDLPDALKWVYEQVGGKLRIFELHSPLQHLVDSILKKAWSYLDDPGVLFWFAKIAWKLLKRCDRVFEDYYNRKNTEFPLQDTVKRKLLVKTLIPNIQEPQKQVHFLTNSRDRLIIPDDISWLLDELTHNTSIHEQEIIAELISQLMKNQTTTESFNLVLERCRKHSQSFNPILEKALSWLVEPVLLDSPEAKIQKENYELVKKWREEDREERHGSLVPLPEELIETALRKVESGISNAWADLVAYISLDENSREYKLVLDDILEQHGWKASSLETQNRIANAAIIYLENAKPNFKAIFNPELSYTLESIAVYPALVLLYEKYPERFDMLDQITWDKWASVVAAYPFSTDNEKHNKFLTKCYQANPGRVLKAIYCKLRLQLKKDQISSLLDRLIPIWDESIASFLYTKIQKYPSLDLKSFECILKILMKQQSLEAQSLAIDLLQSVQSNSNKYNQNTKIAFKLLFTYSASSYWNQLWSFLQADSKFCKDAMLDAVVSIEANGASLSELKEFQTADFYIWLENHFSQNDDPYHEHEKAHWMEPRDQIREIRENCIRRLQNKGTFEACKALEKIIAAYPNRPWLKFNLSETQKTARRATWIPPSPVEILAICADPQKRLVRNDDDLLIVVIESLKRLQERLSGETPQAPFLWDESSGKPKNENRLSDFVKDHLTRDLKTSGIIANREVEIRNLNIRGVGERTDILIQAVEQVSNLDDKNIFSVVIETKGCWNPDLMTSMETQLKNDYLLGSGHSHGLYLVGWFLCSRWADDDQRKKVWKKFDNARSLMTNLEKQATSLTGEKVTIKAFVLDAAY